MYTVYTLTRTHSIYANHIFANSYPRSTAHVSAKMHRRKWMRALAMCTAAGRGVRILLDSLFSFFVLLGVYRCVHPPRKNFRAMIFVRLLNKKHTHTENEEAVLARRCTIQSRTSRTPDVHFLLAVFTLDLTTRQKKTCFFCSSTPVNYQLDI